MHMPILDASTTAAFAAVGISPLLIYQFMQNMVSIVIAFTFWLFTAFLPFWLVLFFIALVFGLIMAYTRLRHH